MKKGDKIKHNITGKTGVIDGFVQTPTNPKEGYYIAVKWDETGICDWPKYYNVIEFKTK